MDKVGIDFGTTNSTLSYMTPQGGLECYKMKGAGSTEYIPSWVSYEKEEDSVGIGNAARNRQLDEDYLVFSRFKILLNETNQDRLKQEGFESKSPERCARDYLKHLLAAYCKENNRAKIEQLVITVPEIWIKENDHTSRKVLESICHELNLPLKRLLSEPVAATAYFSYCFKQQHQRPFDGHVLVCDYGGGTLDLSLSRIHQGQIMVLESTGKGHYDQMLGKAGAAFDQATVQRVAERETGERLSAMDPRFIKLLNEFERNKIDMQEDVDTRLKHHLKTPTIDKKVFQIDGLEVKSSDMKAVFDRIVRDDFLRAFEEMKEYMVEHKVDYQDRERFRVVMAGGFSSFYLVRQEIRSIFGAGIDTEDPRFDASFTLHDTALAISKGAALVANNLIDIDRVCPVSIGLRVFVDGGTGFFKFQDIPLLKKGEKLSQYREPVFLKGGIEVNLDLAMLNNALIFFLGDGKRRRHHKLDKQIEQLLPNIEDADNRWQVGFSVDENLLFTFHAKDRHGKSKQTPLGDILQKYSGLYLT